jgi:hypothetical protein
MSQAIQIERLKEGLQVAFAAGRLDDARAIGVELRKAMQENQDPDLPSGADLPGGAIIEPEKKGSDFSVKDKFIGALETMGTLITSPLAIPATVLGTLDGAVGSQLAGFEPGSPEFNRNMQARKDQLVGQSMYQPQTEAGQEYMQAVGETLAPLEVIEPLLPAMAGMIPNSAVLNSARGAVTSGRAGAADAGIGRNLDGPTDVELEMQKRVEAARTGGDSLPAGERLSVGAAFDENAPSIQADKPAEIIANRFVDEPTTRMYRNASPETREGMVNMLSQAERLAEDPSTKNADLPRAVVGEQVATRAGMVSQVRQRYGQRLKQIVEQNANMPVGTTQLAEQFDSILSSYGIRRTDDGFDMNGSAISDPGTEAALKKIYDRMEQRFEGGQDKFGNLHVDKKWLQDQVQYGPGSGSNNLNSVIKDMAGAVNDTLRFDGDGKLTEYGAANDAYSSTVKPFETIAKISGDKAANFDDPKVTAELARKTRGLTNNTKGGVELEYVLEDLQRLVGEAVERGAITPDEIAAIGFDPKTMEFKGDLGQMGHFASSLDVLYPQMRPTGMQAMIDQGAQTGVDAVTSAGARAVMGDKIGAAKDTLAAMGSTERKVAREAAARAERLAAEKKLRDQVVESLFDMLER